MDYRKKICDAIDILASNVSQRFTDNERDIKISAWHIGLKNITDNQVDIGLEKALSLNNSFFPTCGQFKELCVSEGSLSSVEDEASEAWNLVIGNLSAYKTTIFKNTLIAETIKQMGGWIKLCTTMKSDEEPFRRNEFIQTYQSLKRRNEEFSPLLEGQVDNYRQHIGFKDQAEIEAVEEKILIESKSIQKIASL